MLEQVSVVSRELYSLADEFESALELADEPSGNRTVSLVTGAAAYNFISELVEKAEKKWHNIKRILIKREKELWKLKKQKR